MSEAKSINLGLQGGGAHGAFTWGVLDALLEDGRIRLEAISGISAGAINAVVVADGLAEGGEDGARRALWRFWRAVSFGGWFSPVRRSLLSRLFGDYSLDYSWTFRTYDLVTRLWSPYVLNPANLNPLRRLVNAEVNFERAKNSGLRLFVAATSVRTGHVRVFEGPDIDLDVVMASACVPTLFQAVTIDGEAYWSGGFGGNPPLAPLGEHCTAGDVVLVQTNPFTRARLPRRAYDIANRVSEISFNASLLKELQYFDFVGRLLDEGALPKDRFRKVLFHMIESEKQLEFLEASSKFNTEWTFLLKLHDLGRAAAQRWIDTHFASLGRCSTVDLGALAGHEPPAPEPASLPLTTTSPLEA